VSDNNVYGVILDTTVPNYSTSLIQVGYTIAKDVVGDSRGAGGANGATAQKNLGDIEIANAMVQIPKISNKLDLFAHYAISKTKPNGSTFDASGTGHSTTAGLLTSTPGDKETKTGHAFWIGGRYAINNDYKIGLEYNKGDKFWISMTQGAH
jgi:hypothetical protein